MKRQVVSIPVTAHLDHAVDLFVQRHISTLPVVNDQNRLIGLLTLWDLLGLVMPDFVRLVEDFDFVRDFGAVEDRKPSPETLARSVREVMRPPISVEETSGILRAFAMLRQHDLNDLPVVTADGRLLGIASHVDLGTALLTTWHPGAAKATL